MPSARDVAQYILENRGPMTTMKLQKLVYYTQAWSIVWDDDVLFEEPIEAWKNGPVVRDLWESSRGRFRVAEIPESDISTLTDEQRDTVDRVLEFYGPKDAQWLSDLTHLEDPWRNAYQQGQNTEISLELMSEFYSSIEPETVAS
jgi:uncharacterized phage-associated protein